MLKYEEIAKELEKNISQNELRKEVSFRYLKR